MAKETVDAKTPSRKAGRGRAYTIEAIRSLGESRGGKLLSPEYRGTLEKHEWECGRGHRWSAPPHRIRLGGWCPYCAGQAGLGLHTLIALAQKQGGECLSVEYQGMDKKYLWRCRSGHEWPATGSSLRAGSWCRQCSRVGSSRGERISREVLEEMFGREFPKCRPDWLPGLKGWPLELDGYAESLKIAFEYHGPQHYAADARNGEAAFADQLGRDELKARLCRERGVTLIVVPDFADTNNLSGCIDQIEHAVLWAGLKIPRKYRRPTEALKLVDPLSAIFGKDGLARLRKLAADRGGNLVSTSATRAIDKLLWRCSAGHEFESLAGNVRKGAWCSRCNGGVRKTFAGVQALAAERGGTCISPTYLGATRIHRFRCGAGHEWETTPSSIQQGTWCRKCHIEARRVARLATA